MAGCPAGVRIRPYAGVVGPTVLISTAVSWGGSTANGMFLGPFVLFHQAHLQQIGFDKACCAQSACA